MFVLTAKKNVLTIQQKETLTSGSANVCRVRFSFSEDWDGLNKIAVFRVRKKSWSMLLDENNECIIPWEALKEPRLNLFCGVYGTRDGNTVLPTIWCGFGQIAPGAVPGEETRPHTPELWEQELAKKSDALSYEGGELSLMSGSKVLSKVEISGGGIEIPPGGTAGQVLVKLSDNDYDVGWRDVESRGSVVPSGPYLFGYDIVLADSNPDTRIIYPAGVDNAEFTPAKMDFESDTFSYGSWPSIPGQYFMPKPCLLNFDGTVAYYLNPDNYFQKEDGSRSDIESFSCGGNFMMEWPKIYTKRWETSDGVYHFRCSNEKISDEFECWCNYDVNDKEIDHFYTAIYTSSMDTSGRLRSISGQDNMPANTVLSKTVSAAQLNDVGNKIWTIDTAADYFLLQDLFVLMFKSTNCQTALGNGNTTLENNNPIIPSGTMNDKGLFWGANDYTHGVKVFGTENQWGNVWHMMVGYLNINGTQKLKLTRGKKDGSTVSDYNITGDGYISVSNAIIKSYYTGYIAKMKTETYGRIPLCETGTSTTYEADCLFGHNSKSSVNRGGHRSHKEQAGLFCVAMNSTTGIDAGGANHSTSLSCKPLAKEE